MSIEWIFYFITSLILEVPSTLSFWRYSLERDENIVWFIEEVTVKKEYSKYIFVKQYIQRIHKEEIGNL